jgi:hypothetical protein
MKTYFFLLMLICTPGCCLAQATSANPAVQVFEEKSNPELIAAIKRGDIVLVKKLLEEGANPNSISSDGIQTALSFAISNGDVPMTKLLLNMKASPEALGRHSLSPIFWIGNSAGGTGRRILIIRELLEASVDLNKWDAFGKTFLTQSMRSDLDSISIIEEAIRLGADPTIKNRNGATAIDVAIENDVPAATIDYMKSYKENRGKTMPKFGNTEGVCRVVAVQNEQDSSGLKGMYFMSDKDGCDANNLAQGYSGIFTKYDGTECRGTWKAGVMIYGGCKARF